MRNISRIAGTAVAAACVAGCQRPALTDSGVVAVFGSPGLGWGDFIYPRAIAVAPDGRLFVADKSGRIQRFDADGHFEAGWWMPEYQAGKPIGLTVHPDGRLFVADTHYSRVVIFDRDGQQLGDFGSFGDGPGQFRLVTDVVVDREGFIYVGEYGGNDRISKWSADLTFIKHIADQPIAGVRLSRPAGLVIDEQQTLWVADACNHRVLHLSLDGELLDPVIGGVGQAAGKLRWPYDINICLDGSLLVSEYGNNRLQFFSRDGRSLQTWGSHGRRLGELYSPWGAVEGPTGSVYVLDSLNHRVQIFRT